jgi:selenocysteine-specific elongation factor
MIFALAGHVDHGKTSLIRALTGIDTDRLADEKRRGMTIDLGFAYLDLPDGGRIGFVDVPGHERFLANMLAGVLGIRAALLIVAADDGPMPQTIEHLAILHLTGLTDLTAILTKIDAVDPARLHAAEQSLRQTLSRCGYATAPILPVSSLTGAGLPAVLQLLQAKAATAPPKAAVGGFRLAIDRSFVLPGTGLVVTGTVAAGEAAPGETLMLTPARLAARVRSIRVQDRDAATAKTGDRAALAITGARIEKTKLRRGDWLVAPHLHAPTARIDAWVEVAPGRILARDLRLHVHLAAAAVPARALALAGADLPAGQAGFISLTLDRPIAALHGDPFPNPTRRSRAQRLAALTALRDPTDAFDRWLDVEGYADPHQFAVARNILPLPASDIAVSAALKASLRQALLQALADWHRASPDYPGPGQAALLARLARTHPPQAAEPALRALIADGGIATEGTALRLPAHRPALPEPDEAVWPRVHSLLEQANLRAPRSREIMAALDQTLEQTEALLERYIRFGRLVRVSPNRCYLPPTLQAMQNIAADLAAASDEKAFTAAEFNQATGIGRNLAIEMLEYLDRAGITVRLGELRHMKANSPVENTAP